MSFNKIAIGRSLGPIRVFPTPLPLFRRALPCSGAVLFRGPETQARKRRMVSASDPLSGIRQVEHRLRHVDSVLTQRQPVWLSPAPDLASLAFMAWFRVSATGLARLSV